VLAAESSTMEKFLAALTEQWSDAAGYLQSIGVADGTIEQLRVLLR
jgi:hypothetical protein